MNTKASAEDTADGLKDRIRAQSEFIREQSGKGVNIVEQPRQKPGPLPHQEQHHPEDEEDNSNDDGTQEEDLDAEVFVMMTVSEVVAFGQGLTAHGWMKNIKVPQHVEPWSMHKTTGKHQRASQITNQMFD